MSSTPEPVNFETNHSFNELINNKLGENEVDYPTVEYISNNENTNKQYFDMISGNSIKFVENFNTENFDNISDATEALVLVLVDICDIANYMKSSKISDNVIESINTVFNNIIELIENLRAALKSGSTDLSSLTTQFTSKMNDAKLLQNNELNIKFDKLNADTLNLNKYAAVVVDYNTLQTAVNSKMQAINCPLTFDGATELDGNLSFLENVIKLMKDTLYTFLKNLSTSIAKNPNIVMDAIQEDPTTGTCIVKMIPLQKWVNVIVSIYNQIVDIYIDGQLTSSCVLKKFPDISTSSVNITPDGGFSGMIARVTFSNTAMNIQNARAIYYDGPIYSAPFLSLIPNWVYWIIALVIIIGLGYSFMM